MLLYNSRLKLFLGKLKYGWFRLFSVIQALSHGDVDIKDEKSSAQFKVNSQKLKCDHGQDITKLASFIMLSSK